MTSCPRSGSTKRISTNSSSLTIPESSRLPRRSYVSRLSRHGRGPPSVPVLPSAADPACDCRWPLFLQQVLGQPQQRVYVERLPQRPLRPELTGDRQEVG